MHSRPSVKHVLGVLELSYMVPVLGVLEWSYMVPEKFFSLQMGVWPGVTISTLRLDTDI